MGAGLSPLVSELRATFLAAGITRVDFERIRHGRTERHEVEG